MFYRAYAQEAILGRLLMDIVHGDLTEESIELVNQLDLADIAQPLGHIVGYIQGMSLSAYTKDDLNRGMLDELRIIAIEQMESLYPDPQEKPTWQPDAPIPDHAVSIIKDLLLEILQDKINLETLAAVDTLGDMNDIPEPYKELLSVIQGSREDGKEIADCLLYNLSEIIEEIKKMQRQIASLPYERRSIAHVDIAPIELRPDVNLESESMLSKLQGQVSAFYMIV